MDPVGLKSRSVGPLQNICAFSAYLKLNVFSQNWLISKRPFFDAHSFVKLASAVPELKLQIWTLHFAERRMRRCKADSQSVLHSCLKAHKKDVLKVKGKLVSEQKEGGRTAKMPCGRVVSKSITNDFPRWGLSDIAPNSVKNERNPRFHVSLAENLQMAILRRFLWKVNEPAAGVKGFQWVHKPTRQFASLRTDPDIA